MERGLRKVELSVRLPNSNTSARRLIASMMSESSALRITTALPNHVDGVGASGRRAAQAGRLLNHRGDDGRRCTDAGCGGFEAMLSVSRARCVAIGLALCAIATPGARATPPIAPLAHEDEEWEHDRQPPYAGEGWLASQGGAPPLAFASSGVELRSWIPLLDFDPAVTSASDCWGYASPLGREYALIGLSTGTAFVEVTDPANAQIVAVMPGPVSAWREIKTHQHFAYVVSEGGGGIQVFDLSQIDSGLVTLASTVTTGGRLATHNVAVNPASGRLYRAGGGGTPVLGLRIYSLANAALPVFLGEWNGRYCHDAQVVTWTDPPYAGVEVAFCYANDTSTSGNPGIEILD